MSQNLDVKDKEISSAVVASGISVDAETVTYSEYSKVILRLEPILKNPRPRKDPQDICDQVLVKLGAEGGKLNVKILRTVFEGSGKGVLTDTQFKRLLEQLPTDDAGFIDLVPLTTQM